MSTKGDLLGDLIKTNIDAVADKTNRTDLMRAMGNAIVAEGGLDSRSRATRATAQSFPTSPAYTKIQYDTKVYDELGEYNYVTDFQYKAKKTGYRSVKASLLSANVAWAIGNIWQICLFKNNALYSYGLRTHVQVAGTFYLHSIFTDDVYLEIDDYIDMRCYHNQGGAVNCHVDPRLNYFSIHRLS